MPTGPARSGRPDDKLRIVEGAPCERMNMPTPLPPSLVLRAADGFPLPATGLPLAGREEVSGAARAAFKPRAGG